MMWFLQDGLGVDFRNDLGMNLDGLLASLILQLQEIIIKSCASTMTMFHFPSFPALQEGAPPIYKSSTACQQVAAFEEVLLQIVDVPNFETTFTLARTPCRRLILLSMDVTAFRGGCNDSGYDNIYRKKSGNIVEFLGGKDRSPSMPSDSGFFLDDGKDEK